MILLELERLCAGYCGRPMLRDVSLRIRSGELWCLLGKNGSGKTTLLRCVAGEIKPSSGTIMIKGSRSLGPKARARLLAGVASGGARPDFRARDYVLLGRWPWLSWAGFYAQPDFDAADAAANAAGVADLSRRPLAALSGGQWQSVALARGLGQVWHVEAPLLLLDEPAANLDLARAIAIFQELQGLCAKGWAVLAAMHDCNLAANFCSRIAGLKNGALVFQGVLEAVFNEANLSALYDWPVGVGAHPDSGKPQAYPRLAAWGRANVD